MTTDEALGLAIDDLAARVTSVEADLADLQLSGAPQMRSTAESATVPEPFYSTLDEWVGEYFLPTFIRPLGGEYRWCRQWDEHSEAVGRLESLWRAWEVLRLDPGLGMAAWFTQHMDAQLPVLLGRSGPFAQCSPSRHSPTPAGHFQRVEPTGAAVPTDECGPPGLRHYPDVVADHREGGRGL